VLLQHVLEVDTDFIFSTFNIGSGKNIANFLASYRNPSIKSGMIAEYGLFYKFDK